MTADPIAIARTTPDELTDAIAELLELHVTDRFDAVEGVIVGIN